MRARSWFAAAALIVLTGCRPPIYDIVAVASQEQVAFAAIDRSSWDGEDLHAFRLQLRDRERIVWLIEARGDCRIPDGPWPFPVVYGHVPACFEEVVAARPLRDGALYRIEGNGGLRDGHGFFRIGRAVHNYRWDEVDADVQSWPALRDPRYKASQTPAAPAAADSNATTK